MRGVEQTAGGLDVALGERTHEGAHALDLGDDVAHALLHRHVGQGIQRLLERLELVVGLGDAIGGDAQIGNAENTGASSQVARRWAYWPSLSWCGAWVSTTSSSRPYLSRSKACWETFSSGVSSGRSRAAARGLRCSASSVLVEAAGGGAGHVVLGLDGGVDQRHAAASEEP